MTKSILEEKTIIDLVKIMYRKYMKSKKLILYILNKEKIYSE